METMIGIGVLLVGIGVLWLCFALGVYFFTRTGREGMRIAKMEDERKRGGPLSPFDRRAVPDAAGAGASRRGRTRSGHRAPPRRW